MSDAIRRPRFDSWGSNYHGGGANKSCPLAGENIGTYFALERLQPAAMAQLAAARYRADDNQKARRLLRKNAAQSSKEIDDVRRSPRVLKNNSPPDHFGSRTGCLEIQLLERCLCCGFLLLRFSAACAAAFFCAAFRCFLLSFRADKLDHGHLRRVAAADADFDDPRVAAGTVLEARPDRVE